MHIISRPALIKCWKKHPDSEIAMRTWFQRVKKARWKSLHEIKNDFPSADLIGNNRVVFDIKGNHYRIITVVYIDAGKVYIRFVGTHKEYNKIDARTI